MKVKGGLCEDRVRQDANEQMGFAGRIAASSELVFRFFLGLFASFHVFNMCFCIFLHSPFAVWFLAFFGFLGWSRSTARSENFKCFEIPFNSENKHGWPGGRAKRSLRVTLGGAAWLVTSPM